MLPNFSVFQAVYFQIRKESCAKVFGVPGAQRVEILSSGRGSLINLGKTDREKGAGRDKPRSFALYIAV